MMNLGKPTLFLLLLCFYIPSNSQTLNELYQQSQKAYQEKDYATFLELCRRTMDYHPSQPTLLHNLAGAYALNSKSDSALLILNKLVSFNAAANYDEDKDFDSLKSLAAYKRLQRRVEALKAPMTSSTVYTTLKSGRLHAEDLVLQKKKLFLTDVRGGKIFSGKKGKPERIKIIAEFSSSTIAIAKGPSKNTLWVSTAMFPNFHDYDSIRHYEGGLHLIHSKTGKQLKNFNLSGTHVFGSMCGDGKGNLYLSDSTEPEIYFYDSKADTLGLFLNAVSARNLQGIVFDEAANALWVADYIKGIMRVDLETKEIVWLQSENFIFKGIDGLAKMGEDLIAIQNGANPQRVIRLKISGDTVASVSFLDKSMFDKGEPTNGKYYPGLGFLYLCNTPWPHYDKEGQPIFDKWSSIEVRLLAE